MTGCMVFQQCLGNSEGKCTLYVLTTFWQNRTEGPESHISNISYSVNKFEESSSGKISSWSSLRRDTHWSTYWTKWQSNSFFQHRWLSEMNHLTDFIWSPLTIHSQVSTGLSWNEPFLGQDRTVHTWSMTLSAKPFTTVPQWVHRAHWMMLFLVSVTTYFPQPFWRP